MFSQGKFPADIITIIQKLLLMLRKQSEEKTLTHELSCK